MWSTIRLAFWERTLNKQDVLTTLQTLHPDSVFEIRAFGEYKRWYAYFQSPEEAIPAVEKFLARDSFKGGPPPNLFVTLNPVQPALYARSAGKFKSAGKGSTTTDALVLEQRHLLIDIDPVRGGGVSNIMATDEEIQAAEHVEEVLAAALPDTFGTTPLLTARSGNGQHIIYRLPEGATAEQVKGILADLSIFDKEGATVDTSVWNPSRLTTLYGTMKCKSENTEARPHRLSGLNSVNPDANPIPSFILDSLAQAEEKEETQEKHPNIKRVVDYLDRVGLDYRRMDKPDRAVFELGQCPFDEDHGRTSFIQVRHDGPISAGCQHKTCPVSWQYFKERFGPLSPQPEKVLVTEDDLDLLPPSPLLGWDYEWTEMGATNAFVDRCGKDIKYIPGLKGGTWHIYSHASGLWEQDTKGEVFQRFIDMTASLPEISRKIEDKNARKSANRLVNRVQSNAGVVACVKSAMWSRRLRSDPDVFNKGANLLACKNGLLNMDTGELRPLQQSDMWSCAVEVEYDPNAKCERWERFLHEIQPGRPEVVAFLKRCIGYAFSGYTSEEVFLFLQGHGSNGKSKFVDTLVRLCGPLGVRLSHDALTLGRSGEQTHATHLLSLKGKRIATVTEPSIQKALDVARVKSITTKRPIITARKMHGDPVTFEGQHFIILEANHEPYISEQSNGIWRRLRKVTFDRIFEEDEKEKDLDEQLWAERAGILNWIVEGYQEWRSFGGLRAPRSVLEATDLYKFQGDPLNEFLADECCLGPDFIVPKKELHQAYMNWLGDKMKQGYFTKKLAALHITEARRTYEGRTARVYVGVKLGKAPVQQIGPDVGEEEDVPAFRS